MRNLFHIDWFDREIYKSMQESDDIKEILTEIRDVQKEHLAHYKEVAKRSLELQQQVVTRQEQLGSIYMRLVVFGAGIVIFFVLIVYLLSRLR